MGFLREAVKKIIYSIPNFRVLRDNAQFLEEENKRILEHDRMCEESMNAALRERDEVYAGNLQLQEEINFLKFRNEELSILHDEVVERNWKKDDRRKKLYVPTPLSELTFSLEVKSIPAAADI